VAEELTIAALAGSAGNMKIRAVMARKGDTPEYVNRMQQEVFKVLAESRCLEELQRVEPEALGNSLK
jgi:DNA polymerase I